MRTPPRTAALLALTTAAGFAAGCTAETDPPDVDAIAAVAGCESPVLTETPEPGVLQAYDCTGAGTLLIFEDATAREDFIDVAADDPASWVTGEEWAFQAPG